MVSYHRYAASQPVTPPSGPHVHNTSQHQSVGTAPLYRGIRTFAVRDAARASSDDTAVDFSDVYEGDNASGRLLGGGDGVYERQSLLAAVWGNGNQATKGADGAAKRNGTELWRAFLF